MRIFLSYTLFFFISISGMEPKTVFSVASPKSLLNLTISNIIESVYKKKLFVIDVADVSTPIQKFLKNQKTIIPLSLKEELFRIEKLTLQFRASSIVASWCRIDVNNSHSFANKENEINLTNVVQYARSEVLLHICALEALLKAYNNHQSKKLNIYITFDPEENWYYKPSLCAAYCIDSFQSSYTFRFFQGAYPFGNSVDSVTLLQFLEIACNDLMKKMIDYV